MDILARDEALSVALIKYRDSLPPGISVKLTQFELSWINMLVDRAVIMARLIQSYSRSWLLARLFKEGIGWQIKVEGTSVRKAGLMLELGKQHQLPTLAEVETALGSPVLWGEFWEKYSADLLAASRRADPLMGPIYNKISPPTYIRLPTGWFNIIHLYTDLLEGRSAPGPKPKELIALCKNIVRAFPAPVRYPHDSVDLLSLAAQIIIKRLE